jgi:hypothetical protein
MGFDLNVVWCRSRAPAAAAARWLYVMVNPTVVSISMFCPVLFCGRAPAALCAVRQVRTVQRDVSLYGLQQQQLPLEQC